MKAGMRFMENISGYFSTLLRSLSNEVVELLQEHKDEECLEVINLIDFTYSNLLGSEESFDPEVARDCIKETLSGLYLSLSYLSEEEISASPQLLEPALKVINKLLMKLE
jgi:hypothetical protein